MAVKKDKKTGNWYYYGKYVDINGNTVQYKKRGFETKPKAKIGESDFLKTLNYKVSTKFTLDDIFDEYIVFAQSKVKESTLYNDRKKYNDKIKPTFGTKEITKITSREITIWQNELLKENYAENYINNIRATLSKLYTFAFKMYNIEHNPIKRVDRAKRPNELKKEMAFWTYKEFQQFICHVDNDEYKLFFTLAYMTGSRKGELLALQVKDLNKKTIRIEKTCTQKTGDGYRITPPKTKNSYRKIELDNQTIKMIDDHITKLRDYDDFSDDKFIFGFYRPIAFTTLDRNFKKWQVAAKVKKIRIHDLRHSHVSLLINNQKPLPAIANRIGDTIETVLNTYSHLFEESNQEIISFLNDLDKKPL